MAVILKDMDMPRYCVFCPFGIALNNRQTYCLFKPTKPPCNIGDDIPDYCPLEEVTHGESKNQNRK